MLRALQREAVKLIAGLRIVRELSHCRIPAPSKWQGDRPCATSGNSGRALGHADSAREEHGREIVNEWRKLDVQARNDRNSVGDVIAKNASAFSDFRVPARYYEIAVTGSRSRYLSTSI